MGLFDFFKGKRRQPGLMASGSYDVHIPEDRFVCANVGIRKATRLRAQRGCDGSDA